MQINAILMPNNNQASNNQSTSDTSSNAPNNGQCLVCIARRLAPNERPPGTCVEQFTTKLLTSGRIIGVDCTGIGPTWSRFVSRVRNNFLRIFSHKTFGSTNSSF